MDSGQYVCPRSEGLNIKHITFLLLTATVLSSCYTSKPSGHFSDGTKPSSPDYFDLAMWAAHPEKLDSADVVPDTSLRNDQNTAEADVFFLHPTTYTGTKGQNQWNGPVNNEKLNLKTDRGSIRNQASIFNECYRVFAPRYRQAHYESYFTDNKSAAKKAFDLAYQDVKNAFEFYLKHHNQGRPIVIAGHSQGSSHAIRLLQDYFDDQALKEQLVAAYIPGMLVYQEQFNQLTSCHSADDLGCICAWRTFKEGFTPKKLDLYLADSMLITNPLSWGINDTLVPAKQNPGSVLLSFYDGLVEGAAGAKINDGFLWTPKPIFKGSFWLITKDYHQGDFNLYYKSVRDNACHRLYLYQSLKAEKALEKNIDLDVSKPQSNP